MTEVLLVRHGLPQAADGPDHQPGLSEGGRRQARLLADWLAHERVDAVVSSPLRRARETAAPTGERFGLDVEVLDGLREWERDGGSPAYLPLEDFPADHPQAAALAEGRYEDFVPAFDRRAFRARAGVALDAICERWPEGRVVAVSHAGLINTMIAGILGLDRTFWVLADYTSVSRVQRLASGRTVVHSVNETGHLHPASASKGRTGHEPSQPLDAARTPA